MKICIDPGHSKGYNPSPCGYGYYEGTRMYELSELLKKELEKYENVKVIFSKKNIQDSPSLYDRAKAAEGCDLLISMHSNATGSKVVNGTDYVAVFYSIDDTCKQLATDLASGIAKTMETKQAPQTLKKYNGEKKADYYGIIRNARAMNIPCVLVEHSFHTDTKTTQWLMTLKNLQKLAEVQAEIIAKHYHLTKEDEEMRYETVADIKADTMYGGAYLPTVQKLMKKGVLKGKGGNGDQTIIDLGEDAVRLLVILDRQGAFDEE